MAAKLAIKATAATLFFTLSGWLVYKLWTSSRQIPKRTLLNCVGDTPLIYLSKLSRAVNCEIYCKLEYLNPFGSSKDRAVKKMLETNSGQGVVEASSGSTAISLVHVAHILGIKSIIFLPNDLSEDKYRMLETLRTDIIKVPPVSIVDQNHFYNLAKTHSLNSKAVFTDQFQNTLNAAAHFETTGPEIYRQTLGNLSAFVCSAGTGGTLAGVSRYLKQQNPNISIVLADPQGSGLFNKVKFDILYTREEQQGHRLKNPFDTVVQGVGLNRPTANFSLAIIDDAFTVKDIEALHMAQYLIRNEGLFVGGSSALNLVAVVKYARKVPQSKIVTVLHDSGSRYLHKFYNSAYLKSKGILFEPRETYAGDLLDFVE